jgi:ABC-type Na+ efflux pump permease subunit
MIRNIWMVAARDFTTTVSSKGFLLGLLVMPVLILIVVTAIPRIMNSQSPQVRGDITVLDPTDRVLPELRKSLNPAAIAARRAEVARRAATPGTPQPGQPQGANAPAAPGAGPVPILNIVAAPAQACPSIGPCTAPADISAAVRNLKPALIQKGPAPATQLALVVVHPDAVVRSAPGREYGTYDLYVAKGLDDATEFTIRDGLRSALVSLRLSNTGVDQAEVEAAMRVAPPGSVLVAAAGERNSLRGISHALPFIFGLLLFLGVMSGGQMLMTSTVEEKSSRVVEVLLAAVSPIELMWGKLIGQLGVGLVIMSVYVGLGILTLVQFSLAGLVDPMLVVYLVAFYLITYLVYGSLMLAIGAAVNQMADAQSLMGPVMLLLIAPYVLAPIIGQAPNSTLSVALSFTPPINTFAMMARLASGTPPPAWQVVATMVVGLLAASVAVWFAAKIFKIGLLMHGKPPNFATMIRWARMA